ncbi:hypothetical protein ACFVKB_36885 [Rhodococcus sp. NPDC127530]|uniref:hypothetical protein n=1 Tax=unclassified Rhodococcus (in: high G+C Gram-positive bacteria) TaxID=192944 RepID=UPI00363E121A
MAHRVRRTALLPVTRIRQPSHLHLRAARSAVLRENTEPSIHDEEPAGEGIGCRSLPLRAITVLTAHVGNLLEYTETPEAARYFQSRNNWSVGAATAPAIAPM